MKARLVPVLVTLISLLLASQVSSREALTDSTDIAINATDPMAADKQERESAAFVSPLDPNLVLVSNNAPGASAWITMDAGKSWNHSSAQFSAGDPTVSIIGDSTLAPAGRFLIGHNEGSGPTVQRSDSFGLLWQPTVINTGQPADKSFIWTDNGAQSLGRFDTYSVWTHAGGSHVGVALSDDAAEGYNPTLLLNPGAGTWGAHLQTGRLGTVYVVFPNSDASNANDIVRGYTFAESPDGALAFSQSQIGLTSAQIGGLNGMTGLNGGKRLMASSYPVMAVDRSNPATDYLFLVWAGKPTTSSGPDIRMIKGTNDLSDSNPVQWDTNNIMTVNQDQGDNDQWWPWIVWDECTDMLVVTFMDSRADSTQAETYLAVSIDHGGTWAEVLVSDVSWHVGLLSDGYDYIGLATGDGRAFPVWSDTREGFFRPYTSLVLLWGVSQESVEFSLDTFQNPGTYDLTVDWETNIDATASNSVTWTSPSLGSYTANSSTSGTAHSATFSSIPAETGSWTFTVTSDRNECIQQRHSDPVEVLFPRAQDVQIETESLTSRHASWVDYDLDGDPDLYVSNSNGLNRMLRNNLNNSFTEDTQATLRNAGPSNASVWGDYDNDGDPDLYVVNGNAANVLLQNDGSVFTDVTPTALAITEDSRSASWVDYDNDGDLDLYVVNYNSANLLLRNQGCTFTNVASGALADAGKGEDAIWGDYNGDGFVDVYLVSDGQINRLLKGEGTSSFSEVASPDLYDANAGRSAAWGDYDNDGDLDILLTNHDSGIEILRNQSNDLFLSMEVSSLQNSNEAIWSDQDNDGDLDIFVARSNENLYFKNEASMFVGANGPGISGSGDTKAASAIDIDLDRLPELYCANDGVNRARNIFDPTGNYLSLHLVPSASNESCIGTRIVVLASGKQMVRQVVRHHERDLIIGIGSALQADMVNVDWPSGNTTSLMAVVANQELTVEECDPFAPTIVESSMNGWSSSGVTGSMTVHFAFQTTLVPSSYEIEFRVQGADEWETISCGSSNNCIINCTSYEATTSATCGVVNYEWRAQATNCQGTGLQSSIKTFRTMCLTGP